jgi:c-di-GMP-binding flagellar brake protein YcgR
MKLESVLRINQKVEIELADSNRKNTVSEKYPSRVEDMNDNSVVLASPIKDRIPVFIPVDGRIDVSFSDPSGSYMFSTRVQKYIRELVNQIVVAKPTELIRIQQREYVRLNVNVGIRIAVTNGGEFSEHEGVTNDLSGGGCRVAVPGSMTFEHNQEVSFSMELNKKTIIGKGRIIWQKIEREPDKPDRVLIGVQFERLSEDNVKFIMQYVYLQQIEFRRKGLS